MSQQLKLFDTSIVAEDKVIENVRHKLLTRSTVGIKKYNTTLTQNNKDNYLNHLQQEMMDASNYIEKLLMQKDDITQLVKDIPNDQLLGETIRQKYS